MDTLQDDRLKPDETHIEMWRHYDTLRQAKNNGFLTANSILAAITGFLIKEDKAAVLIVNVAAVGMIVCASWFLLLTRNAAYIELHRKMAGGGDKEYWMPKTRTPRSKYLDRVPSVAFFLFWGFILIYMVPKLIPR